MVTTLGDEDGWQSDERGHNQPSENEGFAIPDRQDHDPSLRIDHMLFRRIPIESKSKSDPRG